MAEMERRVLPGSEIEWRLADDTDGSFEGYLSVWDVTDSYGTRFRRGAYSRGGLDAERVFPLLDMHDTSSAVRSVLGGFTAAEDDRGLVVRGRFAPTQAGQDARALAALGFAPDLSVGFERVENDEEDATSIVAARLVEGSLIIRGFAATPGAEVVAVRSKSGAEAALRLRRQLLLERLGGI